MVMLSGTASAVRAPSRPVAFALGPAGAAHIAAMATIYREQVVDGLGTWEDPIPGTEEIRRRLEAVQAAGLPAYVALDANRLVLGFCWAKPFRDRAAYRETVEDSIYVARRARRHGVGRALLAAVIEACAHLGCRQMIAVIGDARNRPSTRLHESLGFNAVGFLPAAGMKPTGPVDVVIMQRSLEGPTAGGGSARA